MKNYLLTDFKTEIHFQALKDLFPKKVTLIIEGDTDFTYQIIKLFMNVIKGGDVEVIT